MPYQESIMSLKDKRFKYDLESPQHTNLCHTRRIVCHKKIRELNMT